MIGYLAISDSWSRSPSGAALTAEQQQDAKNHMSRVHGYPHPTLFLGVRNAFRALRKRYDRLGDAQSKNVTGHVRILDLACLPIMRFEDLAFEDRRAILTSKKNTTFRRDPLSEEMLQVARDVTVPDLVESDADELYNQLQVAERQMQIWTERTDKIRAEFEYVKHATPVQKAKRRLRK